MLTLHLPRCLLHSSHCLQIRTLRTLPRKIPTYTRIVRPNLHEPLSPDETIPTNKPAAGLVHPTTRIPPPEPAKIGLRNANKGTKKNAGHRKIRMVPVDLEQTRARTLTLFKRVARIARSARSGALKDDGLRHRFWRVYSMAKSADPHFQTVISNRDWRSLWAVQAAESEDPVRRALRLVELYYDMASVGMDTTVRQRTEHLASSIFLGRDAEILDQFKGDPSTRGFRSQPSKPEHLEMDANLYAHAGNLPYAREIIDKLFAKHRKWDPSVIITVFRLHTSSVLTRDNGGAEDIYHRTKARLGSNMTLELFDAFLQGFREAQRLESAKQVFADMVRGGCLATSESANDLNQVLERLHVLYSCMELDMAIMSNIATHAIMVLPEQYHGHIYGDWLQAAVIRQAPEAASQVFDLMLQRGFMPGTFHFNMLLEALFRAQHSPDVLKAENIGWQMISEARKADPKPASKSSSKLRSDRPLRRSQYYPPADVTTFALVMHHHAKKLEWENVEYLLRQLKESHIRPNTAMMNVLMHTKTRQGAYMETWLIYKEITNPLDNVDITTLDLFPNGATIRHLWVMLRLALADPKYQQSPHVLPGPRKLLRQTIKWWHMCKRRHDASRFQLGLTATDRGAITALILHCFTYTKDLPGTLVALHVLRHEFNIYPTPREVAILKRQIAWMGNPGEDVPDSDKLEFRQEKRMANNQVEHLWQIVQGQRLARMGLTVGEAVKLEGNEAREVGINLMSEVIRVALKRNYGAEGAEKAIKIAKSNIGFKGTTGDLTAWEVA